MLRLGNLTVRYGAARVLEGISASLRPGTFTALIGPNGSGKSSLLRAVAGLQTHGGSVALGDQVLDSRARGRDIAYMPQDTGATSSLTLLEVVLLGRIRSLSLSVPRDLIGGALSALARFGLDAIQHRTLDQVSGGQRQLVFLAQAMFRSPKVLLLDEPTSALDLRHQLVVLEQVRQRVATDGVIAVAAMHDLTQAASFADRILCLSGGRLAGDGTPADVLNAGLLRQTYRVRADIHDVGQGILSVVPRSAI